MRRSRVVSFQSYEYLYFFFLIFQFFLRVKFFLRHGEGCITWNVILVVYNLIDYSSRPMGGRIYAVRPQSHQSFSLLLKKKLLKSSEK